MSAWRIHHLLNFLPLFICIFYYFLGLFYIMNMWGCSNIIYYYTIVLFGSINNYLFKFYRIIGISVFQCDVIGNSDLRQPQKSNDLPTIRIRYVYERKVVLLFKFYIFSKPIVN